MTSIDHGNRHLLRGEICVHTQHENSCSFHFAILFRSESVHAMGVMNHPVLSYASRLAPICQVHPPLSQRITHDTQTPLPARVSPAATFLQNSHPPVSLPIIFPPNKLLFSLALQENIIYLYQIIFSSSIIQWQDGRAV